MSPAFNIARARRWVAADARVLGADTPQRDAQGFGRVDILVEAGRIGAVAPAGTADFGDAPRLPLAGRIATPAFVDAHTHLDKGHIWRRAPNSSGAFADAVQTTARDRATRWSAADVAARMEFALRCAYANGTRAMRTHLDSVRPQAAISFPVFAALRERWRGRVELQASPLFGVDVLFEPGHLETIEAIVEAHGSKLLGAVTYMIPRLQEALDALFAVAERRGWDLDFHVDESADPAARSLGAIAETALARRFAGKILVGHCCSLARQDERERDEVIDKVARAKIDVVSLPMCNMFLQDRQAGRTPRWRGVTALHELKAAGVEVMIAGDNTRDPFYAYGDLDMLEVWREGVRILHLDYPHADWADAVGAAPARAMRLAPPRLAVGEPADMILTQARDFTELFARPHGDRVVVRDGAALDAAPPAYAELDALEGLAP
ncbi:MAG: cytosine deaminase [Pseudomonadota bacterium]|nr:cytosine deaminase [Pseudomonadota bacterium]